MFIKINANNTIGCAMSIPKKITPCPLIDCAIEFRFKSSIEPGAVFGIVYNAFKNDYPNIKKMPILNLPEQLRSVDPSLIYQPWYRLWNGGFVLATGPRELMLGRAGEYPGWTVFSGKLNHAVNTLEKLGIVDRIERVGIRYINFFDFDIFDRIKLTLAIDNKSITGNETLVRVNIPGEHFMSRLHVTNRASVNIEGVSKTGSVIDIDTHLDVGLDDFFQNSASVIKEGHNEEKKVFFELLKDDFLETLAPEY